VTTKRRTKPCAATIWTFREALKRAGAVEKLFQHFDTALKAADYLAMMSGQIVDATIIAAPRQRNSEAEKEAIKAGAGQPQLPAAEVRFSFRSKG
jgi:transposase, IS5 family